MQVSVESTGNLERRMTFQVPAERLESDIGGRLREIARTTRLKGFRPGKVPVSLLRKQYGRSVMGEVVEQAVKALEEAGAEVTEVTMDLDLDQRDLADLWCRLIMPLNLAAFASLKEGGLDIIGDHRDELPPEFLRWHDHVAEMSVMDYFDDNSTRTQVYDALQGVLDQHRILVSPTLACMPPRNETTGETRGPTVIAGVEVDPVIGWCMTYFTNLTGHPAASAPAGLSNGLPVGMQLIGRRQADVDVLTASAAFERVRPWSGIYDIPANRDLAVPR